MKSMLVSDFDRTFFLNEEDIKKNKIAIKKWQDQGNIFVIATGRSYLDLMMDVKKYNIQFDYALLDHGATTIDAKENILNCFPLKDELINHLKDSLKLEKASHSFCCSKLESRVDFNHKDITKIGVDYKNNVDSINIYDKIKSEFKVNVYTVGKKALEIITIDTDKSNSIKLLANKLGVENSKIYTIGDSYNDINMIKDYNGFAMKDSIDELRKITKKQYQSVSDLINDILNNNIL